MINDSIYSYLNVSQFLSDQFEALKRENPRLTSKMWASQIGFKSSQALVDILKGKAAVKMSMVSLFEKALNLDKAQLNYFRSLVLYSNLKSKEEKDVLESLLSQYKPVSNEPVIRINDGSIYSSWLDGAILEMGRLKNFKMSETQISKCLRKKVHDEVLKDRIQKLAQAGLLKSEDDGSFKITRAKVTTSSDMPIESIEKYYSEVTELAREAVRLPVHDREFQCFSMALNPANLPIIKTMVRDFRSRLAKIGGCENSSTVYQVNLQCFPLMIEEDFDDENVSSTMVNSDCGAV